MPLVRVDLVQGKPEAYRQAIGDVVYAAMVATLNVPKDDRFVILNEHAATNLSLSADYLGIARSADCIVIQVTLNGGRTTPMKQAFYLAVAEGLHQRIGLRMEDVFISLVEVTKDNWSFGNGLAQYA